MPHAVFNLGTQAATADLNARQLIPGVEPGMGIRNIFAQRRLKRALLIQDAWIEPVSVNPDGEALHTCTVHLKLSQESDLGPGLLLPISQFGGEIIEATAVGQYAFPLHLNDLFRSQGTVWAPAWVGIRIVIVGFSGVDVDVHLDYEVVEIPWEQWFIGWDFLDNVVDNERQY